MQKWQMTPELMKWAEMVEGYGCDVMAGSPNYPDEHFIADLTIAKRQLGAKAAEAFNSVNAKEEWLAGENLPANVDRFETIWALKKKL